MAKQVVNDIEAYLKQDEGVTRHLQTLERDRHQTRAVMQGLKNDHEDTLRMRAYITKLLTADDVLEKGLAELVSEIFDYTGNYIEVTRESQHYIVKKRDHSAWITNDDSGHILKRVKKVMGALGLELKNETRNQVTIDRTALKALLEPIMRDTPENRKAALDKMWEKCDAEEIAADHGHVSAAMQRATFLEDALNPAASTNGKQSHLG